MMKRCANTARYMLIGALLAPMASWANTWSACQTITSITDYTAYSQSIYLNLSPGIAGCVADTNGAAIIRLNATAGLTADAYKSLYATTLLAFTTGKQVMVYYDSSQVPACLASVVSIGGTTNQCP